MAVVTLITHTPEPEKAVAAAAKLCYSHVGVTEISDNLTEEKTASFVKMLSDLGHESPTEHVTFTFGIEGVSRGQREAGQVLGMTKSQIFFKVTLLQMVKRIVPPMSNEIITLVKDTSLARVIAITEIIKAGENFIKSDGIIWPLFYTAVYYLIMVGLLTILFNHIERKLSYFR